MEETPFRKSRIQQFRNPRKNENSTSMTRMEAAQIGVSEEDYMTEARKFHPLGLGEPVDVAYLDLFLASDESKWITGAEFTVDGGFTAQ